MLHTSGYPFFFLHCEVVKETLLTDFCIQTSWRQYYFCEFLPTHSNMHNIHCVRHFTTRLLIYSLIFKENGISFFLDVCFLAKLFKLFYLWVKIHFFNFFTNVSRFFFFKLVNFAVIVLITIDFK